MGLKLGLSHKGRTFRLMMFEKWVHRRILGPKTDEVTGGWSKLYNG
jgi:hypothetical protein